MNKLLLLTSTSNNPEAVVIPEKLGVLAVVLARTRQKIFFVILVFVKKKIKKIKHFRKA